MGSRESSQKRKRTNTTMVKVSLLTSMGTIVILMGRQWGRVRKVSRSLVDAKGQRGRRSKRAGMPVPPRVRPGNREIKREARRILAMK